MRRLLAGAACFGLLGVLAPVAQGAPQAPFQATTKTFANGLRLVMVPGGPPGLLAYYTLVRVGSRDEVEKGVTGFAHFFEHMMFRGTKAHPPEAVQALLKKAGADQNGFTTNDFTCYTFLGNAQYLEALVRYEADRIQNLRYSKNVFKTEAGAVLGEYNKNSSSTWLPLQEQVRKIAFRRHTYGHTTLGYVEDIKDMPNQYAYSLKFFDRFYTPDNTTLIVVGDFEPERLVKLVDSAYGDWKKKRAQVRVPIEPPQKTGARAHVAFPGETLPILSMAWRTPATDFSSPDTAVFNLLHELLFGRISPLYTELVLDKQLVASFSDWNGNRRDPYVFQAIAHVKRQADVPLVEKRINEVVAALSEGELDARLLADVKAHVLYEQLLDLESPDRIALLLAFTIAPTGKADGLQHLLKAIDAVTPADVQRFAQAHLTPRSQTVVTLTGKGGGS